jgi:hypothetical protein
VILARSRSSRYLLTESIAGATLIAFTVLGTRLWGIAGLGIAYTGMYVVYFLVVSAMTWREFGIRLDRANLLLLGRGVAGAVLIAVLGVTGTDVVHRVGGMIVALAAVVISVRALASESATLRHRFGLRKAGAESR